VVYYFNDYFIANFLQAYFVVLKKFENRPLGAYLMKLGVEY